MSLAELCFTTGLHQNNNKKRLKGYTNNEKYWKWKLYPDEFLANNQKVYGIIGKKFNNISKYIQNNKTLITKLDQNKSIEKIIIVKIKIF